MSILRIILVWCVLGKECIPVVVIARWCCNEVFWRRPDFVDRNPSNTPIVMASFAEEESSFKDCAIIVVEGDSACTKFACCFLMP